MNPVLRYMPVELTSDLLRAVREHPTTSVEDKEEWYARCGWLICAWDVLMAEVEKRDSNRDAVQIPSDALKWLFGEVGTFEPPGAGLAPPKGYKLPTYWWRSEFKRRAGL
jgi:hypothetical protein